MPIEATLARAEADLRAGRTALARRRVRDLVRAFPHRLDLRHRLAEIYRLEGNPAQAGRWTYLHEPTDPAEQAAFAKAYQHDPVQLMRALAWHGVEDDAPNDTAHDRLRLLREQAEARVGTPLDWHDPRPPRPRPDLKTRLTHAGCLTLTLALLTATGLVIAGLVRALLRALSGAPG